MQIEVGTVERVVSSLFVRLTRTNCETI